MLHVQFRCHQRANGLLKASADIIKTQMIVCSLPAKDYTWKVRRKKRGLNSPRARLTFVNRLEDFDAILSVLASSIFFSSRLYLHFRLQQVMNNETVCMFMPWWRRVIYNANSYMTSMTQVAFVPLNNKRGFETAEKVKRCQRNMV